MSIVHLTAHPLQCCRFCQFCLCRTVYLAAEDLDGQGTFGMEGNTENKEIPLEIREGSSAIRLVPNIKCVRVTKVEFFAWSVFAFQIELEALQKLQTTQSEGMME